MGMRLLALGMSGLAAFGARAAEGVGAPAADPGPLVAPGPLPFPTIERFENFGMSQGMPCHKIHGVLKASDGRLWVGTWDGLLVREDGKFRRYTKDEGLTHKMVLSLAEDARTGHLWGGPMRGFIRRGRRWRCRRCGASRSCSAAPSTR